MSRLTKKSIITAAAIAFVLGLAGGPGAAHAATAASLGAESTYGVVSDTFTNSNTSPQTIVNGDVCGTTLTIPLPLLITGATNTPCTNGADQVAALSALNLQSCTNITVAPTTNLDAVIIGANAPGIFPPGCYSTTGAMNIVAGATVTLDATAPGGVGNVWIFRPGAALTTEDNSHVVLAHGANANNVFWTPVGATTLGANATLSSIPTFIGNIFRGNAAGLSITLGHFANLLGRALAFGSTVTTDANTITVPTTLHVIKLVVNGSGGTGPGILTPSDFSIHLKNASGTEVGGGPYVGAAAPGTSYSLAAGAYVVSEDSNTSYVQSFSLVGDCDSNGNVMLATGDDKICTIVNTDIPVPAPVVPPAAPSGGGGGGNGRIVPLIGILKVPTPLALPDGPGSVTYNYTVWNVGGTQALTNVTIVDDKCTPGALLSGDINSNNKLDPGENWRYSCTATLASTTTNTAVATGHSDDGYNQAAIATAIATVVVGASVPPPLINIVKVPSRLTPFQYGGGEVTYGYTVTNPGLVPMSDVSVTDDKCAPVVRTSGDTNGNTLLDPSEAWTYTCRTNVSVSTRNIATVVGKANGFTALGYAFATVLVSAPSLPNTGLPQSVSWDIVMLLVILVGSISLGVFLRRRRV